MEILVFENGSRIEADALYREFPELTIRGTADISEADADEHDVGLEAVARVRDHVVDPEVAALSSPTTTSSKARPAWYFSPVKMNGTALSSTTLMNIFSPEVPHRSGRRCRRQ